jgi:hypothetical protein
MHSHPASAAGQAVAAPALPADLARLSLPEVRDLLRRQADETARQAAEATRQGTEAARLSASLQHAEAKNQALTLELAHLRRLRFGVKSEA